MSNKIVKLNIGGFKYATTRETLLKVPNTYFGGLLNTLHTHLLDDEGAYFIDRDGQYFPPILTWLRSGTLVVPNNMTKDDILREARFFSIEPLVEEIISASASMDEESPLECPSEIQKYVGEYFTRHEGTIMNIVKQLNKEGNTSVSLQIIPGHRIDFERPPQMLESGKLGLYMNFTSILPSNAKYAHVQAHLAKEFKQRGFSGYYRPSNGGSNLLELWWVSKDLHREHDIVYF